MAWNGDPTSVSSSTARCAAADISTGPPKPNRPWIRAIADSTDLVHDQRLYVRGEGWNPESWISVRLCTDLTDWDHCEGLGVRPGRRVECELERLVNHWHPVQSRSLSHRANREAGVSGARNIVVTGMAGALGASLILIKAVTH